MEEKKEEIKEENVFKKLLKKEIIISFVVGVLLGLIIMFFVKGGFVAIVNGKVITTGSLYNKMKDYYSINLVLEDVDAKILNRKYKLSEEELNDLKKQADDDIKQFEDHGYTQEEFFEYYGFSDYDEFLEYLEVDYKRTIYFYDYLETKLEENAVKNYYDEYAFGKVNTKHILVRTSDDMTDDQALALANDIITRLNNGEDFDTLATEYKDNYSGNVVVEDLGEIGAFDNIEETYINAMKELEVGKYTETPVKTSYGYHVIYCVDKKEKTEEISHEDKMAIVNLIAEEEELEINDTTYYQALIQMREEANLKFFDKDLKTKYEEYCAMYVDETTEE